MYDSKTKQRFPGAFVCTVVSAAVFGAALILGACMAAWPIWSQVAGTAVDPYNGCTLAVDYAVRAAQLCIPTLGGLGLIWLAAYVRFERPMLALLFALRGFGCGSALRFALSAAVPMLACAAAVHGLITVIFLMLVFHIRTENQIRPLSDSLTALLIAGGASSAVVILATFLLR